MAKLHSSDGDWAPGELETQEVFELPDREVLTLVDPSLTNGALSYLSGLPTSGVTPSPTTSPSPSPAPAPDPSAATTAQNATHLNTFAPQSTLTTSNVNSAGATSGGMTSQYAPITQGS